MLGLDRQSEQQFRQGWRQPREKYRYLSSNCPVLEAASSLHKKRLVSSASTSIVLILTGTCLLLCPSKAAAQELPPLAMAEARIGQGLALGGGSGESTWRFSPMSLSALASLAIESEPHVAVFGGLVFEGGKRAGIGATLGLRLNPKAGRSRVSAAGIIMAAPFTAYGVSVGLGRCHGVFGGTGFCTDIEATVFALGSDIPEARIATQVQAVLGFAIDVM